MTTTIASRPLPAPEVNAETMAFWDAAASGRFMLPRCDDCHRHHWYPRALCPHCFSNRVSLQPASGQGVVYSFTVFRREKLPYVLAYVTLAEGPTMLTNLVDCDADALAVGQPVRVQLQATEGGPPVPVFRPAAATQP